MVRDEFTNFTTGLQLFTRTSITSSVGDIIYGCTMGQQVIVLNSLKAVTDLFEKRSHIYSDRPVIPMRDM